MRKHKNLARFVAALGVLPGIWFLLYRYTQIGERLEIRCGYWIVALVILSVIWVMYAILTKILMKDIGLAHEHAHSFEERRHYKLAYASTAFEALIASIIFALSLLGFFMADIGCVLERLLHIKL